MTFEEEFPSITRELNEDRIELQRFLKEQIQRTCLDKQRVKEAIQRICTLREGVFEDCVCEEELLEELGL